MAYFGAVHIWDVENDNEHAALREQAIEFDFLLVHQPFKLSIHGVIPLGLGEWLWTDYYNIEVKERPFRCKRLFLDNFLVLELEVD
jgi:hypothetical protein